MAPQEERINKLINAIFEVHQYEDMDCQKCCEQFDCLVDLVNTGANLRDLLPAVEEHLRCCPDCNEEFEALIKVIRAENGGLIFTSTDNRTPPA